MRTRKTIGILLLLAALTVAVVLIPQLISKRREAKRINKIIYRDYNASERAVLTDGQVARLYYERQIDINGNSRMVGNKGDDEELIRRGVTELTDRLFGKGTDLGEPFNTRIEESNLSCSRNSCLILVDNHPTALNFVSCYIKENNIVFEIIYEEKTKTLLRFGVDASAVQFRNVEEAEQYSTRVEWQIQAYFKDELQLGSEKYYCDVDISKAGEGKEGDCSVNAVIRCGISQVEEKGE